jgi:carbon-monoxide dehydrogenase medium subunit
MVSLKGNRVLPDVLIDISRIREIRGITFGHETVRVGSATTYSEVLGCAVSSMLPKVLTEAAALVGSPQVRNLATLGGNLCTASPAGDMCIALLSLDSVLHVVSTRQERDIALPDFFLAPGKTALLHDEIITDIAFRMPLRSAYRKLGLRKAVTVSIVSVAGTVFSSANDGHDWRLAIGAAAPTPIRARQAECIMRLTGSPEAAGSAVSVDISPITDLRATAEYRVRMAKALTVEVLARISA